MYTEPTYLEKSWNLRLKNSTLIEPFKTSFLSVSLAVKSIFTLKFLLASCWVSGAYVGRLCGDRA